MAKRSHSFSEEEQSYEFSPVKRFDFDDCAPASNPVRQLESKFSLDDYVLEGDADASNGSDNKEFGFSLDTPINRLSESTSSLSLFSPLKKNPNMTYASPVSVLLGSQEMSPDYGTDSDFIKSSHSKAMNKKFHSTNLTPIKKPYLMSNLQLGFQKGSDTKPIHGQSVLQEEKTPVQSSPKKMLESPAPKHFSLSLPDSHDIQIEIPSNSMREASLPNYFRLASEMSDKNFVENEDEMQDYFEDDSSSNPQTPRTPQSTLPSFSLDCPESPIPSTRSREMCRQSSLNDTKVLLTTQLKRSHSIFMFNKHFEYLREIGRGSFSTVYEARDRRKGTLCAVKMSKREFDSKEDREMYMHEIESVANLPEHPNIVKYYRGWQQDLHFFIQMELCEGGSLRDHLDKLKCPLPEKQIWKYIHQIASALHHLHSRNVLHLDIKPANIFLDSDGILKIGDFGRAVLSHQWQCEEGDGGYLAPEMLSLGNASPAADMYSFGAMCYEWVTVSLLPRDWNERKLASENLRNYRNSSTTATSLVGLVKTMLSEIPTERPSAEAILERCRMVSLSL